MIPDPYRRAWTTSACMAFSMRVLLSRRNILISEMTRRFFYMTRIVSTRVRQSPRQGPLMLSHVLRCPSVGRGIRKDNNGPPTFPTQIFRTSNHGSMTRQAQQEYPVTLKNDIEFETGQNSCPECGKKFRSKSTGVINRHRDDVHSNPQICPHSKCKAKLKGKRKLKYHLSVHHKAAPPN
ncbi:hypothetical protein BGW80DRAFT_837422 [Lactifluus volemus]|nr:hypothetical protein BGW80DRAFT_837422 [Lactifluus volemus]